MLVLGPPELRADATAPFAPERRFQLLAVLAVRSGQWVPRDELAALLWPEHANAAARRNLRHVIFKARGLPGIDGIDASEHALRWHVSTDLLAFDEALRDGRLLDAVGSRRGALLAGIDDPANAALGEWLAAERARFDLRWQQATHEALRAATDAPQRADLAQRLLELDPLDEVATDALLQAELALGQRAAAERHYRDYAHRLAAELGVEPSRRVRDLFAPAAAAGVADTGRTAEARGSTFVGRRSELAELTALLVTPGCRLVTVVGPGGIGKSRLASQLLHRLATSPGTGIWIELQDLTDLAALTARLAQRLGVVITDARNPIERIGRHLGSGRTWCVLDNAEHLGELPAWAERLLAAAPSLVLLVTSRTRLRIAAERAFTLSGLAVPDEDSRDLEAASAFDAVRLFESRAQVAQRSFDLARHLPAVIEIVEAVDAMPLAIELAAAWVRLLPPEEIARELRDSFVLLERDPASRDAPARPEHRSVLAVLERTWQLLAPAERNAMAALSVFGGGFSRAAAVAVADAPLPLLSSLVDKSLLTVNEEGRFGMHPVVAAQAAARLATDGARERACRDRHAEHFAKLVGSLAAQAAANHQRLCAGIDSEYANCLAAWRHAVARGRTEWITTSIAAWRIYFEVRGRTGEGIDHFQAALDPGAEGPGQPALAAEVRAALSRMHYMRGEHQTGLTIAQSGIELAERCADRRALARCLTNAGSCHAAQAQWSAARPLFERTLAIGRADGVVDEVATALSNLGIVAKNEGRYDDALACYAQALAVERERGRYAGVVRCLSNLGGLHLSRGEWASARHCMEEGLRLSELHRIDFFVPIHACGLGESLLELGELGDAERHLDRALERCRSADNPIIAVTAEANLARVQMRRGNLEAALVRLRAAARTAHERGLTNMALHVALLFGDWMREVGRASDAARVWRMVISHPKADAGMRDAVRRHSDALTLSAGEQAAARGDAPTLEATLDRLLRGGDVGAADASR
jgi:predicted ATPase/DNA-binding SARP family transcriptional activator